MAKRRRLTRRFWGIAEIADTLQVTRQAVSNWNARGKMPKPAFQLKMGPVWVLEGEFAKWIEEKRKGVYNG